jgi:hypothetical protein
VLGDDTVAETSAMMPDLAIFDVVSIIWHIATQRLIHVVRETVVR